MGHPVFADGHPVVRLAGFGGDALENEMQRVSEARVRVRYAETDQMGVVYHANYLVWSSWTVWNSWGLEAAFCESWCSDMRGFLFPGGSG